MSRLIAQVIIYHVGDFSSGVGPTVGPTFDVQGWVNKPERQKAMRLLDVRRVEVLPIYEPEDK